MYNYRIVLSFDGTRYFGWQRLKENDSTLQGKIEKCIFEMTGYKVDICGCGRTDAGAHALNYTANFFLKEELEPLYIKKYLNTYLPHDINISACERAPERFHARLNVRKKTYAYRIWNSEEHNVFEHRYLYEFPQKLDLSKMEEAKEFFIGTHDFAAFCSNKRCKKSTVRTIYDIEIIDSFPEIKIIYTGSGFLYNMVRILTGTLVEIGIDKKTSQDINKIFESKERINAGFTVPAKGLILTDVYY